jgi:hypothetical protein
VDKKTGIAIMVADDATPAVWKKIMRAALIAMAFALGASGAFAQGRAEFDLPGIAKPTSQEPARLIVAPPLPDALARGLVVIQYRAENLRIVPVYGPAALSDTPRIGHLHVTIDDAPWHWLDASNEPLIIQGRTPGPHRVPIELADPTHRVIDGKTVSLEIPQRPGAR